LDWVGRFASEAPCFASGGASLRADVVQLPLDGVVAALSLSMTFVFLIGFGVALSATQMTFVFLIGFGVA